MRLFTTGLPRRRGSLNFMTMSGCRANYALTGSGQEKRASNRHIPKNILTRCLVVFLPELRLIPGRPRQSSSANRSSRFILVAFGQNSEAVHGPRQLIHRNPHLQPAEPRSKASKRRKEFIDSPANSCQCFCVMDAPEIYQPPGLMVVSKFLTAVQASDVGFPAMDGSAVGDVRWNCLAQCYRGTLMPMRTDKDKTKQRA